MKKIIELCGDAEKVIFQFSGGKDSQSALEIFSPYFKKAGMPIECVFVDTGAEFPSVVRYVKKYCGENGLPLKILKGENAIDYFKRKGYFPHPVYRDCIHDLINKPVNRYAKEERAVVITGHNLKQKGGRIKPEPIKIRNGVKVINPFYIFEPKINGRFWPGYKKGFQRTACFCCPFQEEPQLEAMRKYYPNLWNKMADLCREIPVVVLTDRPSGGIAYARMKSYWQNKFGIKLKLKT